MSRTTDEAEMENVNNIYRGQHKVSKEMDVSFEKYWQKNGVESKDGRIKAVMEAVYGVLQEDARKSLADADYNQALFDRAEFRQLVRVLQDLLSEYLVLEASDFQGKSDEVKEKARDQVQEIVDKYLKSLAKEIRASSQAVPEVSDAERRRISSRLRKVLREFFSASGRAKAQSQGAASGGGGTLAQFNDALRQYANKDGNQEEALYKRLSRTQKFKEFQQKLAQRLNRNLTAATTSVRRQAEAANNPTGALDKLLPHAPSLIGDLVAIRRGKSEKEKKYTQLIDSQMTAQEKETFKNANAISKHMDGMKTMFVERFMMVGTAAKWILSPIGKLASGVGKSISHPLETLDKFFSKSWLGGLIGNSLKYPQTWYVMGVLTAKAQKRIEGPMYKYMLNPLARAAVGVTDLLSGAEALFDERSTMGKILSNVAKLAKKRGNIGAFPSMLVNAAEMVGADAVGLLNTFTTLGPLAAKYLHGIVNITLSGKLSYFKGAGMIQKLLLLSAYTQGGALGSVFEQIRGGKDEVLLKLMTGHEERRDELTRRIAKTFGQNGQLDEAGLAIQTRIIKDYDDLQKEFLTIFELQTIEKRLETGEGAISDVEVARFREGTDIFDQSKVKKAFETAYRSAGYETFEQAGIVGGRQVQLDILKQLINQRLATATSAEYRFADEGELKRLYGNMRVPEFQLIKPEDLDRANTALESIKTAKKLYSHEELMEDYRQSHTLSLNDPSLRNQGIVEGWGPKTRPRTKGEIEEGQNAYRVLDVVAGTSPERTRTTTRMATAPQVRIPETMPFDDIYEDKSSGFGVFTPDFLIQQVRMNSLVAHVEDLERVNKALADAVDVVRMQGSQLSVSNNIIVNLQANEEVSDTAK